MPEGLRITARERRGSRTRAVVLAAVLAFTWGTLLPLAHASSSSHSGECGVCSVIAHGGTTVADAPLIPEISSNGTSVALELLEIDQTPLRRDFDARCARAPPSTVDIG